MTRLNQLAARFAWSPSRIRGALAQLREEIAVLECSDDRAHTGRNRDRLRQMLADEAALSGALRRMAEGRLPEQLEFPFA